MRASLLTLTLLAATASGAELPFVPDRTLQVISEEVSGEVAMRNLEGISRQHRMRASKQYREAADLVAAELKRYGYADAHVDEFPVDGEIFYGTQRSRPAWNAELAELWEERPGGERIRLADWNAEPLTLAQDSASGEATGALIDVGSGTSEADYAGKEIRGNFVLTSSQPGGVVPLAVARFGAAGIVSYAQNQPTAWWGEDENLIRWGHLDTFSPTPAYAFMVTLKQARDFQRRLRSGEVVTLHGAVRATRSSGSYAIPMATIRGSRYPAEEIIYSCHLDHPRPGANDNASGCATILEVARTLRKLVDEKRLTPPLRTIRFVWPPEIEGTLAILTARPQIRTAAKAAIHLDMVGGGEETKAIFHVTRGPASLPSFVYDVAASVGELVNRQSAALAMTGSARWPLVANGGGKEALLAQMVPFTPGSDHQVYSEGSFRIPAIYLNDWPDRYIHTNGDTAAKIDPTKLERAAFIAAVTGYVLANLEADDIPAVWNVIQPHALRRVATTMADNVSLPESERRNAYRFELAYEREVASSLTSFVGETNRRPEFESFFGKLATLLDAEAKPPEPSGHVYTRNRELPGPMSAFGYDYFAAHYGEEAAGKLRLSSYSGLRGRGAEYTYELLNLIDGRRTTSEVRDALSAMYGPVPVDVVEEYLAALEKVGVVKRTK